VGSALIVTGSGHPSVAVLGAGGIMGGPMAANIARAGLTVRAWNRSPEKLAGIGRHGPAGPSRHETALEAATGADVVLTMLSDAGAVLEVMREPLAHAPRGTVWLQMSTIGLEGTRRCAELAAEHGLPFFDAPVLGTRLPAEQGTLVVLASGPDELRARVEPVFDAVGGRTMWLGEAGRGSRLKLAVNSWVLTVVEGAAETLALAEGLGLDPAQVLEAVAGGALDLPYLQAKGKAIIARDFREVSFRLALAAKDAGLVVDAGAEAGLELALMEAIRRRMSEAAAEHGDEDMAATVYATAR
jgi:3-hydroxyisobutyrate dehydrogenase